MFSSLEALVANMTVRELAQRSGRSIEAITSWALAGTSIRRPTNGRSSSSVGDVNTRTTEGREAFDAAVLRAVRNAGGTARSAEIEAAVGGTPLQRRVALARLVEQRKLKRSGKARATTYALR